MLQVVIVIEIGRNREVELVPLEVDEIDIVDQGRLVLVAIANVINLELVEEGHVAEAEEDLARGKFSLLTAAGAGYGFESIIVNIILYTERGGID